MEGRGKQAGRCARQGGREPPRPPLPLPLPPGGAHTVGARELKGVRRARERGGTRGGEPAHPTNLQRWQGRGKQHRRGRGGGSGRCPAGPSRHDGRGRLASGGSRPRRQGRRYKRHGGWRRGLGGERERKERGDEGRPDRWASRSPG